MNWSRGFRRVYALAVCGWLFWWTILYPIRQKERYDEEADRYFANCVVAIDGPRLKEDVKKCEERSNAMRGATVGSIYLDLARAPASAALALGWLLIPPALTFALLLWVTRGFKVT